MAYQKNNKLVAGIAFRPEILAFLDELAEREGRTRSNLVNQLAREYAESKGFNLQGYKAHDNQSGTNNQSA